jgi:hypothetical protein
VEYSHFEQKVIMIAGDMHYSEYNYLLHVIPASFRERFLHTLNLGFKIPEAVDHISKAGKLAEHNYYHYINYLHDCVSN